MKCPLCGYTDTRVLDSRPVEGGITLRRRRVCGECDGRFTTHERVVMAPIFVQKKDGRREEFQPDKLRNGISKACNKRPVSVDAIHAIIAEVESALRQEGKSEVDSFVIGEMVMERLYHLDQVAYVRFASVYHRFDDVKRFAQLLDRISRRPKRRSDTHTIPGTSTHEITTIVSLTAKNEQPSDQPPVTPSVPPNTLPASDSKIASGDSGP